MLSQKTARVWRIHRAWLEDQVALVFQDFDVRMARKHLDDPARTIDFWMAIHTVWERSIFVVVDLVDAQVVDDDHVLRRAGGEADQFLS